MAIKLELKQSARERFAAANGWHFVWRGFSMVLASGKCNDGGHGGCDVLDHREYYREGGRRHSRPAAMVKGNSLR
jgi:hypothetical protein